MTHDVVLIPGDGIGPEITEAMRRVVEATGVSITWHVEQAGAGVMDEYGTPLPQRVLDAVSKVGVAIKGPITTPIGTGFRSVNVALRHAFNLYACVRPCLSLPGDGSRYRDVDLVIFRENTEDLYAGIEFDPGAPEVAALAGLVDQAAVFGGVFGVLKLVVAPMGGDIRKRAFHAKLLSPHVRGAEKAALMSRLRKGRD
mgnify:CR=1 FL=1